MAISIIAASPKVSSVIFVFLQPSDAFMREPGEADANDNDSHNADNAEVEQYAEFPGFIATAKPASQEDEHGKKRQCPPSEKVNALLHALG